ncbi:hypothetical protein B9Z19DRAFT_1124605 [Tuber borchii]|uniref:Uncharacterized protein n=1 Tax=Tuber borchii TaxID=42251 RepID=A0A2T6ZWH3_TUBBO|nr:hypothetical protein B9Z19DRAFT_1124605 [Tuber borchii]
MKFKYFETKWKLPPDWIQNAKAEVQKLWESTYKPPPPTMQEQTLYVAQYVITTAATPTPESLIVYTSDVRRSGTAVQQFEVTFIGLPQ